MMPELDRLGFFFALILLQCPLLTSNARFFVWVFTFSVKSGQVEIACDEHRSIYHHLN